MEILQFSSLHAVDVHTTEKLYNWTYISKICDESSCRASSIWLYYKTCAHMYLHEKCDMVDATMLSSWYIYTQPSPIISYALYMYIWFPTSALGIEVRNGHSVSSTDTADCTYFPSYKEAVKEWNWKFVMICLLMKALIFFHGILTSTITV